SIYASHSSALLPFFTTLPRPPRSTPFPYTTLFRSAFEPEDWGDEADTWENRLVHVYCQKGDRYVDVRGITDNEDAFFDEFADELDRKSTRLNSSHVSISYAVFCLKKKKKALAAAQT